MTIFWETQIFTNLGALEISISAAALFSASAGPVSAGNGGLLRSLVLGGSISGSLFLFLLRKTAKNLIN